jgi:hypothetical protein
MSGWASRTATSTRLPILFRPDNSGGGAAGHSRREAYEQNNEVVGALEMGDGGNGSVAAGGLSLGWLRG